MCLCANCSKITMIPPIESRRLPTTRNWPRQCISASIREHRRKSRRSRKNFSIVHTRLTRTRLEQQASPGDTRTGFDSWQRACSRLRERIPASRAHRTAEEEPHVWGSDPGGAPGFDFVAVRLHSASRTHPRKRGPCSTLRRRTLLQFTCRLRRQRVFFACERAIVQPTYSNTRSSKQCTRREQ